MSSAIEKRVRFSSPWVSAATAEGTSRPFFSDEGSGNSHPVDATPTTVKKGRFTEQQMIDILREARRTTVEETAAKHAVDESTIYAWHERFGPMDAADARRLRELEVENARLKKLLAERDLDIDLLQEINARKW